MKDILKNHLITIVALIAIVIPLTIFGVAIHFVFDMIQRSSMLYLMTWMGIFGYAYYLIYKRVK
jgi:hypothetical protein